MSGSRGKGNLDTGNKFFRFIIFSPFSQVILAVTKRQEIYL